MCLEYYLKPKLSSMFLRSINLAKFVGVNSEKRAPEGAFWGGVTDSTWRVERKYHTCFHKCFGGLTQTTKYELISPTPIFPPLPDSLRH